MLDPFSLQQMDCSGTLWLVYRYMGGIMLGFHLIYEHREESEEETAIVVFEYGRLLMFMSGFSDQC